MDAVAGLHVSSALPSGEIAVRAGAFMAAVGVVYGLLLGLGLSVVLVHVVNRQSFHWTLDYVVPIGSLGIVATALVAAAAVTAGLTGRIATSDAVVRAVREDW